MSVVYTGSLILDADELIRNRRPEVLVELIRYREQKEHDDTMELLRYWEEQWEFGEYLLESYGGWFV